jgi:hypothetical protein
MIETNLLDEDIHGPCFFWIEKTHSLSKERVRLIQFLEPITKPSWMNLTIWVCCYFLSKTVFDPAGDTSNV